MKAEEKRAIIEAILKAAKLIEDSVAKAQPKVGGTAQSGPPLDTRLRAELESIFARLKTDK